MLERRRQAERAFGLADPAPHRGIAVEVKPPSCASQRIGQQRDVGERKTVAGQKPRRGELMLHPRQRRIAAPDLVGIEIGPGLTQYFIWKQHTAT